MANDGTCDSIRALQFELSRRGRESAAISLEVAIIRGGNGAGRQGAVGDPGGASRHLPQGARTVQRRLRPGDQ